MSYYLGVEIELIAEPLRIEHPLLRQIYYEKLARSVNQQGGSAIADKLDEKYRKHPEHYNKWLITRDGSLGDPSYPRIPLEAVSPILSTDRHWENAIDVFWRAWNHVFKTPDSSRLCGSHIHVSPSPRKAFTLVQLKNIAFGVILYEDLIMELLPQCRHSNNYCLKNTLRSRKLKNMKSSETGTSWGYPCAVWKYISNEIDDKEELRDFMQEGLDTRKSRYVLWNFDNILPNRSGTVEFRGGHGLRDPAETRMWIAFVVAFIHLCQQNHYETQDDISLSAQHQSMDMFWASMTTAAMSVNVRQHLPSDWRGMTASPRDNCHGGRADNRARVNDWVPEDDNYIASKSDEDSDDDSRRIAVVIQRSSMPRPTYQPIPNPPRPFYQENHYTYPPPYSPYTTNGSAVPIYFPLGPAPLPCTTCAVYPTYAPCAVCTAYMYAWMHRSAG
ncbi:putative amidoligase enzyme-domain-containing protein [Xylariaceae sp. AK1471]|nr:putative amidoligase enzyme-domain-containing protein [Xylariaceae sp. AK1471]